MLSTTSVLVSARERSVSDCLSIPTRDGQSLHLDISVLVNSRRTPGYGVHQVPGGCEEQGKMEEIGCKIIFDAPTTLAVKG